MTLPREAADRLAAAKLWLVTSDAGTGTGDMPYLSTAVYAMQPVVSERVVGLAVDSRWRLYVDVPWLMATDVPDVGRELAHLALHLLHDHAARADDVGVTRRTSAAWRRAADATVAEQLDDAAGRPPAPGWSALPTASDLGLVPRRSAEEHFAVLSGLPVARPRPGQDDDGGPDDDGPDPSCGSGADGRARPYEVIDGDLGVDAHTARSIRERVAIEYTQHPRRAGTQPGEWDRWVQKILEPVVDWRSVLHAAVRRGIGWASGQTDYTYSRPSRRQAAVPSVVLPALRRPVPRAAVVVDTSGSVDDGLLAQALGEVDGVLSSLGVGGGQVTVLAVDAAVQAVSAVRRASDVRLGGGGGTDMALGIAAALQTKPRPDVVVLLTDGETGWPPQPTPVPLVGVILGHPWESVLPSTPDWIVRVECRPG